MIIRGLVASLLLVCIGCAASTILTDYLDPQSLNRLASLSDETGVVASVTTKGEPKLPPLSGGRVLGRTNNSVLVEIPKSAVGDLGAVQGLKHATVWGPSDMAGKIDAGLRTQLLELAGDKNYTELIPMIATFDSKTGLEDRLRSAGAQIRTVAGRVVTFDANFLSALKVLSLDGLTSLVKPRQVKTLRDHGSKRNAAMAATLPMAWQG